MREKRPRKQGRVLALLPFLIAALAGAGVVFAPGTTENAKANGDTRTIYLHHAHTKESIAATFMVDGQYDSAVLEKLNWFLRDWRRDEPTHMDPRLFDVIWTVYRESGSAQPIEVMSAYRSPETNAMLRRRSRQVAEHSQHILGKAMDQHYVDVPMSRVREIAMKLQRGGVGFYPTAGSPFVHMDVGGVRHWPRMSYDQLARLFPDGKTVHIPSNGQPLPGYEMARAELEARGDSFNYPTATEVKSKGFFAWLFGGRDDEDEAAAALPQQGRSGRRGQQRVASIDTNSSGSVVTPGSGVGMNSKDGDMRAFAMNAAAPPPSSYGTMPQRRQAPMQQAALQAPAVSEPDPQAEQALAQAMAEQERAKREAAAKAEALAAAPAAPAMEPPAPSNTLPQMVAAAAADPTIAPTVPIPPRRPVELAAPGPDAPLPPGRPPQIAALLPLPKTVQPATGTAHDAIAALLGPVPGRAAGLPAAILRGGGAQKPPTQIMAFAAPLGSSASASATASVPRIAVPIPMPRPNFVAARLDRSNFRVLTGTEDARKSPARTGVGSAVGALRSAAKSNIGTLAGQASPGATIGFGTRASDLATDHFSGSAVKPRDHVVTSNGASAATRAD